MRTSSLLCLVVPFVAAALTAQTPAHLVGITQNVPGLRHQSHGACNLLMQCPLPGMPPATPLPPWVGGTAWDPVRSGAWVTNGVFVAKYDDNCVMQCAPAPLPMIGPPFITGLELVEGRNELWAIDGLGVLHSYTNTCPPTPINQCNTGLGPTAIGNVTSGLAIDEGLGLVFIAHPVFPAGPNFIHVVPLNGPCASVAQFIVPPCFAGFGAVTGLACDWGNQILYATDGFSTVAMQYAWAPPALVITGLTCCPVAGGNDPLIGLAVRPGRATSLGQSCGNAPCPPCPQIHSLANDPSLGNAQFRLALDQAPSNALTVLTLGVGPCMPPGVAVPPLCGPLYTLPLLGTLGPNLTGGGGGPCTGSTTFNLPLPLAPGLAGQVFSSQCVTLCLGGGGAGFAQSNCLSWQVQGN